MKRILIVTLLLLNVGLLAAVAMRWMPKAGAQGVRAPGDYLLLTAKFDSNTESAFVIDQNRRRMRVCRVELQPKPRLVVLRSSLRDLAKDFGREQK